MKRRQKRITVLTAGIIAPVLTVLIILFVIVPSTRPSTIPIGAIISLTGYGSDMVAVKNGMELAVDKINQHGGINGKNLQLIVKDNKSDPETAVSVFNHMENEYRPLLYTTAMSSLSLAIGPEAEKTQVPLVCQVATNPSVTRGKQWVFSFFPTAEDEIPPILSIIRRFNIEQMGILYHEDPYGIAVYQELKERLADEATVLKAVEYSLDTRDFSQYVDRLKNTGALYAVGYGSHLRALFREAREQGYSGILLGPSTASTPSFRKQEAAQGVFVAAPIIYKKNYKLARKIKQEYESGYQSPFNHYAATGYEFINIVSNLVENVKEVTRATIRDQLVQGFIYPGLFGDTVIERGGHVIRFPLYPAYIQDSELEYSIKSNMIKSSKQ